MNEPNGMPLERFPVTGLRHVRDLIYFDGPLLSLFKHANGENYLYYWCDCDEKANRWMVLRVAEVSVLRLINRIIPVSEVIPSGARDDYIYFLDIHENDLIKAYLSLPDNVPDSYRPAAGNFLEPQDNIEDSHSYSFLLQGNWSVETIGDFPKTFNKLYSVIYGMNVLHTAGYTSHPWRGGFSSMHFFNEAMSDVPPRDRPFIEAMQKSSPGFMRFSLHGHTAKQVVRCVFDFKSKEWLINDASTRLKQYIRRHALNDIESSDSPDWEPFNQRLIMLSKNLLSHFGIINEIQFTEMCPRPFEAAKISLTFVKYVNDLVNFERQGLVEFPKQLLGTSDLAS